MLLLKKRFISEIGKFFPCGIDRENRTLIKWSKCFLKVCSSFKHSMGLMRLKNGEKFMIWKAISQSLISKLDGRSDMSIVRKEFCSAWKCR